MAGSWSPVPPQQINGIVWERNIAESDHGAEHMKQCPKFTRDIVNIASRQDKHGLFILMRSFLKDCILKSRAFQHEAC
jgi:hypothetical protein